MLIAFSVLSNNAVDVLAKRQRNQKSKRIPNWSFQVREYSTGMKLIRRGYFRNVTVSTLVAWSFDRFWNGDGRFCTLISASATQSHLSNRNSRKNVGPESRCRLHHRRLSAFVNSSRFLSRRRVFAGTQIDPVIPPNDREQDWRRATRRQRRNAGIKFLNTQIDHRRNTHTVRISAKDL